MSKRVLMIMSHHQSDSLCAALSEHYMNSAQDAGHEVRYLALHSLRFDPVLHHGYRDVQTLEPDLVEAQHQILWADHLVFAFPVWWGGVPARLKGFLERILLPGFAFSYTGGTLFPVPLLKGRSADLLLTLDTPPWYYRWIQRQPAITQLHRPTLGLCGIRLKKTLTFGPVLGSSPQRRARWLERAGRLAQRL